jgi:transcriptional regulator with XRE-family HTH domain
MSTVNIVLYGKSRYYYGNMMLADAAPAWKGVSMRIGDRLRATREKQGYTVRELGRLAGVRYATISDLENGHRTSMTTDTAKALARALGVGIDYLVGTWEEDEHPPKPERKRRSARVGA